MKKAKKTRRKKEKTYICVVCDTKKKGSKSMKCCGKNMLTEDKIPTD